MDETKPEPSRRDAAKAERRRRIMDAAASLVRERGFDSVSMVDIARRAGVSPATPYNLFQTKTAIFQQLYDLDLQDFQERLAKRAAPDALVRIFTAIELVGVMYRQDSEFYRAMWSSGAIEGEHLDADVRGSRLTMWRDMVAQAVATGCLRADVDPDLLAVTLWQLMRGVFLDWLSGAISARRFAQEVSFGFALMALGYATASTASDLRQRVEALGRELAEARRCEDPA
jgi:AcrR family transcriptional regulator